MIRRCFGFPHARTTFRSLARGLKTTGAPRKPPTPSNKVTLPKREPTPTASKNVGPRDADPNFAQTYPERLLIYSSSPRKTALVAFIKLTAIFSFGGATLYWGTEIIAQQDQSNLDVLKLALISAIPMIVVSYITSPYVTSIQVSLPAKARGSYAQVSHFLKGRIPGRTLISFTTVRFLPWRAKITKTQLETLYPAKRGLLRYANVVRKLNDSQLAAGRQMSLVQRLRLWRSEPQYKFYAPKSKSAMKRSRVPEAWSWVLENIEMKNKV